jgi:predicted transcriptional regulator
MEKPIIRQSINRTVTVGPDLKARLDEAARAEGADADYLARVVLRRYLDTHEPRARAESDE